MKHLASIPLGLAVFACQASAQESVYTHVNSDTCHTVSETDEGGGYSIIERCQGQGGWQVYFDSGEHGSRSGFSRQDTPPEGMPYGGYVGNFGGFHDVIEWRLDPESDAFATIHRYNSTSFDSDGEPRNNSILIVAALRPGEGVESCHVGYVNTTGLAGGNALARQMADGLASGFVCGDPIWIVDSAHPDLASARRQDR